jgi:hypothetical protein
VSNSAEYSVFYDQRNSKLIEAAANNVIWILMMDLFTYNLGTRIDRIVYNKIDLTI